MTGIPEISFLYAAFFCRRSSLRRSVETASSIGAAVSGISGDAEATTPGRSRKEPLRARLRSNCIPSNS